MSQNHPAKSELEITATLAAGEGRERVEHALVMLRQEWRKGFPGGMSFTIATQSVRRLGIHAVSGQLADDLARVVALMDAYQAQPVVERKASLPVIADALKRLMPRLSALERPARQTGVLEAPARPPRTAAPRRAAPESSSGSPLLETVAPAPTPVPHPVATPPRKPLTSLDPSEPVTRLHGAGGATSKKLAKLGVETIEDLLYLAPRRHIDYSRTIRIGEALLSSPGSEVTVRGTIADVQVHRGPGKPRVTIKLADGANWVRATWFNQYLANVLHVRDDIVISGVLEGSYGPLSFTGPEWERAGTGADGVSTGRLVPVYPLTAGLAQKSLRNFTRQALDTALDQVEDAVPSTFLARLTSGDSERFSDALMPLPQAISQVHYPESQQALREAKLRLAFDDLFLLQIGLVQRKREGQAFDGIAITANRDLLQRWEAGLPFQLTGAQRAALAEVTADLAAAKPMARLLQGDVGSGKTAVAAGAMLAVVAAGHQAAIMAPTEILAEQHLQGLQRLFAGLDAAEQPRIALLTGSTKASERRAILQAAQASELDVLVGTHAIIQDGVDLPHLALSIVDEQHRFGVRQRATLSSKGEGRAPHQLAMTATPIPRTLNLVLHGDLDVSVLDERPPGRVPIETQRFFGADRDQAYALVREQVAAGRQVFVICPLVEASDAIEAKAAIEEAERLRLDVFPQMRIATLHGRLKSREKEAVMTGFRAHEFDLLVSTSVVEVGIDVPNATVMLIEGADRFGLAQLHQFRGRVGRGGARSYCFLLADEASPDGEARLETMVASDDGFLLAERDLELRGPGDFIGTRQSGLPEMQWLEGVFDTRLLNRARLAAEELLHDDPNLEKHPQLRDRFQRFWERAAPEKSV